MLRWKYVLPILAATIWCVAPYGVAQVAAHDEPPPPSDIPGQFQPDTCTNKASCGELQPLTPMQSAEGVHAGLVWKTGAESPKLLFHARFPEFMGKDIADPDAIDAAIAAGKLFNGIGAPPNDGNDFDFSLRNSFKQLVYGGFLLRQGLARSVPTRIHYNLFMERALLFDPTHPSAFANHGVFDVALLDTDDFELNLSAFKETGFSRGLNYNLYCNGAATLEDGRVVFVGGHDMNSNNGLFKVNIFNPETETWAPRTRPCTRQNWADDPFGTKLFAADPHAPYYPGCNPLEIESTQPDDPSDMKYARWYPTAIILPNSKVLVLGGTDQDATLGPSPVPFPRDNNSDAAFRASKIHQVVPEIYDPVTDRTIALENARKIWSVYPQAEIVQTGPGRNDWKVCAIGGQSAISDSPLGIQFDGPYTGKTWCLDVHAALADPDRNVPAEKHWTLIDEAAEGHDYCCSTASLLTLGKKGQTLSHKVVLFAGKEPIPGSTNPNARRATKTVQMIDWAQPNPHWVRQGDLLQTGLNHHSVPLPDGTVVITSGRDTSKGTFEEFHSLRLQHFNPVDGSVRQLAKTTVSRGLHGNVFLMPDATIFIVGEDRINLVPRGDRAFPPGDPDLGVPNGQIFKPPYLFKADGTLAPRPVIESAPKGITYREEFDISVAGPASNIGSIVLMRTDVNTHGLTTGIRYVKLAFEVDDKKGKHGRIEVKAPSHVAQAVPGNYMLFVLNKAGVPSVAKHVHLTRHEDEKHEDEKHEREDREREEREHDRHANR